MRYRRALATTLSTTVLASLGLVLSGCASGEPESGQSAGHNAADVDFATDMIQHHAQALSMVDLTMGRELSAETTELTEQIRDAQAPEIEKMADWLQEWGEPVPETSRDHANAHAGDHGAGGEMDTDMPGMMTAEQMEALENAGDDEFEDLWLEMMIEHHEGAVAMAEDQVDKGAHAGAIELAQGVIEGQEAEIATMQQLLER